LTLPIKVASLVFYKTNSKNLKLKNWTKGEINMVKVLSFNKQSINLDKKKMGQGYIDMGEINLEQSNVAASTNFDGEEFINSIK
jgi:hypothetical protein